MKYPCEIIQDLMPLVQDGVASRQSTLITERHIKECETCRRIYEDCKHELKIQDKVISNENEVEEIH